MTATEPERFASEKVSWKHRKVRDRCKEPEKIDKWSVGACVHLVCVRIEPLISSHRF